ncbi:bacterial extracellular solute-binding s, 3 family protein [Mycolicibacterium hassiacum DSM 44199]|jgi:polar amino acid transport system substrate-binding protein|uniref:Bacterial extracellular solute-binding s, 3 family protein n=1 Tax=Mycolicibacterium hassiacum (strain DSM 44199 / CIP 105218 / JCM 12690 / 3849) TaxID=1122247 RepID=K5BCS5_MYCHD|nr:glutamate ABC transporter substrate-binding protein [Mycolicibacterium hassiacum]EKF25460.1 bacterial extracellular solute-binding s, 3 family protein [Mycolicibacterium hassiacum DSM 44199]MBX5486555.1 glutamate ABC transporter substrate-binding protein [Mycolicibacterium hassiacum]MDA4086169.1 ABC transporter substrate-binding protein [Mycolicibacterium hassiacum DSM 44199]PZN24070.1 MAG: ABC transporter substrate-binding protein [Mycolicibacterium hassiacum]VCT92986.1 ABC transporter glu
MHTRTTGRRSRIPGLLLAGVLALAGCAESPPVVQLPSVTLAPVTPAGMQELPPEPPRVPARDAENCDRTASLRPFADRAEAEEAVANIRARGRLIVGLDIGSNLFSFRDPITGDITGFDVDIAGEIARDIFGSPSQVEYRILSSADRIAALENNQVDVVVKTMTITCERKQKVGFSTVYLVANQRILAPRDSSIRQAADLSGRRVCVAKGTTSLQRVREISPPPLIVGVVTWADCLVALQQRQVEAVSTDDSILAGLVVQDPYLHIVGPSMSEEPYGIGVNKNNTGLVRFVNGTLERIRRDGTWNTLYRKWLSVLGPAPSPPPARYSD